jgi:hypothetical protein
MAPGLSPRTQGISALNSISVPSMAMTPPSAAMWQKASKRFYVSKFQVFRMEKGEGLQAFYSIDHLIMNLLKVSIHISSPRTPEIWKFEMDSHLSMK